MRVSLVLVATLSLGWPISTYADEPNNFQSGEISSDALVAGVQSCVEAARKSQLATPHNAIVKYCTCVGDAQIQRAQITTEVINQCAAFARKHTHKTTPVRGPYHGSTAFNADQIVGAVLGCEKTKEAASLPMRTRQRFCGCLVDAMRFERTMLISDSSTTKCKLILKKR